MMNIEKIKNYNQKLLAFIGTLVLLIVIIGFLSLLVFVLSEIGSSFTREENNMGIIAQEEVQELEQENKRKQVISYNLPQLVDTVNLIYMIPVSHKTLKKAEDINEDDTSPRSSSYSKTSARYSKRYNGNFNNLLIYDHMKGETTKLYQGRMHFDYIKTEYFEDDILLLFKASTKDTNKDGVIDHKDLKSLLLYSLKDKKLRTVTLEKTDIYQYSFVEDKKELLIEFGIDYNKDGKYNASVEPTLIKKYDYKNDQLLDVIDPTLTDELQKQLQGTLSK
ncbi:hypothetical protein [Flammeovirga sp. SJP92]|uniref:hypothetical protein n=1 Tax=Flammeovirga sp. SJP92 TaxID=1775430 RepID=UPI0007899D12|nr:hypothetical protein [Flammeovirga sp. SJP92]KXX70561.1 hypothetical protein AVL50_08130 [Flammeovirga sp. SJP92]